MNQPIVTSPTAAAIDKAKAAGRSAVIGYLPVGYSTWQASVDAAKVLIDNGFDALELGLPYSDPVMDGPVIEQAVVEALAGGVRITDTFRAVEALAQYQVPILVMTYFNPVHCYGVDRFAADLANAGGAGLITPDLIPDEASQWLEVSDQHGLDRVFLVAPSSTDQRLALTAQACRGFTYATSTMGVTGERAVLSSRAAQLVSRTRAAGAQRVCVGVGVSTASQARQVATFADGVIIGSALVRALGDTTTEPLTSLANLAAQLRQAVA
jgi:tryptophan synthase alpha chain